MSPLTKEDSRAPDLSGFLGDAERVGVANPGPFFPQMQSLAALECSTFKYSISLQEKTVQDFKNQHKMLFMLWLRFSSEVSIDPGFTLNSIYVSIHVAVHLSGADSCLKSSWLV